MIYDIPEPASPVRQGDIFRFIPRIELNLSDMSFVSNGETFSNDWLNVASTKDAITAVVSMRPVLGIVITQDCDAVRAPDIALCEISRFEEVEASAQTVKSTKKMVGLITKQARVNQKWFYLPAEPGIGFTCKMAADFRSVLRVPRSYLESNIARLRVARLNDTADEHFRERLAEFFRRYPYDEWYPLDKAEFESYRSEKPEPIEPYSWQK